MAEFDICLSSVSDESEKSTTLDVWARISSMHLLQIELFHDSVGCCLMEQKSWKNQELLITQLAVARINRRCKCESDSRLIAES